MNSLMPRFASSVFDDPTDLLFRDFFEANSLFDSLLSQTPKKIGYPVDVKTTDKGLEFDVAVVGLDKKDVKIEIKDDNILSIAYQKNDKTEPESNYIYKGITHRSFNMAWKIHTKFDLSKLSAKMDKGLLKIVVPLVEEKEPRYVEIKD